MATLRTGCPSTWRPGLRGLTEGDIRRSSAGRGIERLTGLAAGTLSLALLPKQPQPTVAWNVVFPSNRRPSPPQPASLTIGVDRAVDDG